MNTENLTYEQILTKHQNIVKKLAALKTEEREVRELLIAGAFPNVTAEGTHTFEMADGRVLKATINYSRSVDATAVQPVIEQLRSIGVDTTRLFNWKPSLVVGEYNKLSPEAQKAADAAITTKPGAPTLKVVSPCVTTYV